MAWIAAVKTISKEELVIGDKRNVRELIWHKKLLVVSVSHILNRSVLTLPAALS